MARPVPIEDILQKHPEQEVWIEVPVNPVVEDTKNLAGAEAVAGLVNIVGTLLAATVTQNPLLLALAGPVLEKAGFPLWELGKACFSKMRDPSISWSKLVKDGMRGMLTTLRQDIVWHDPSYVILMTLILWRTGAHPGLASAIAFLAAIPIAAILETAAQELGHVLVRRVSMWKGFLWETYYETRFIIQDPIEARRLFLDLCKEFRLGNRNTSRYHDRYHRHRLPTFGRRLGLLRMRDVQSIRGPYGSFRNLELSYTLIAKKASPASEHNLFYLKKEKGRYEMGEWHRPRVYGMVDWRSPTPITFERTIAHDDEIRVALDKVAWDGGRHFWILELKAYHESEEFFRAMRHILRHSSALTCTYSKSQIVQRFRSASRPGPSRPRRPPSARGRRGKRMSGT